MGDRTSIEWTRGDDGSAGATWNPIRGTAGRWACTRVSPGCDSCYAARLNVRFGGPDYAQPGDPLNDTLRLDEKALLKPLSWRAPRRIFVCSMTDLFHEDVPIEWLDRIFGIMAESQRHTFIVLTKRPSRMLDYLVSTGPAMRIMSAQPGGYVWRGWPLPNAWLGVSIELDRYAWRANYLRETPAAVRWISAEPLLGPLPSLDLAGIHWLVAGGESGGAAERRLVELCPGTSCGHPDCGPHDHCLSHANADGGSGWVRKGAAYEWVAELRDRCQAAGVAFFLKQWGGARPTSGGRLLDGIEHNEMPGRVAVLA